MHAAAELHEFERAARLRDQAVAQRAVLEKQAVVLGDGTDADAVAFASDELQTAVQVFHVRGGRIRGQRGWVVEGITEAGVGELVEQFCLQVYGDETSSDAIPREVLVPELPIDHAALAELLSERRGVTVSLRVPRRGEKRSLLETVQRNAEQALATHKLTRASDLTARSAALNELAEALEMSEAPLRIECYDISHTSGVDRVGSMVVFEDGAARKPEYRSFSVRGEDGGDDTAAISEVLRRRFTRYLTSLQPEEEPGEDLVEAPKGFAYPPSLVVVDGGQPQVQAAARTLAELGVFEVLPALKVVGLAKRLEEVWLPENAFPVILPRSSEALYLLQRLRDEAHRFAIKGHRGQRGKRMTTSALDAVAGLGEARRTALLRHFGSLKRLKQATPEQLTEVPGIGPALAAAIVAAIAPRPKE
jgi:excinuclease ABC subunit C